MLGRLNLELFHFPTSDFKRLGLSMKCFCVVFCVICSDTENLGWTATSINVMATAGELHGRRGGCNLAFSVDFRSVWWFWASSSAQFAMTWVFGDWWPPCLGDAPSVASRIRHPFVVSYLPCQGLFICLLAPFANCSILFLFSFLFLQQESLTNGNRNPRIKWFPYC